MFYLAIDMMKNIGGYPSLLSITMSIAWSILTAVHSNQITPKTNGNQSYILKELKNKVLKRIKMALLQKTYTYKRPTLQKTYYTKDILYKRPTLQKTYSTKDLLYKRPTIQKIYT